MFGHEMSRPPANLDEVPVKMERNPLGTMLLLPRDQHLVVVPFEETDLGAPSMDRDWRCIVAQSQNMFSCPEGTELVVSRQELRRSVPMMAVIRSC